MIRSIVVQPSDKWYLSFFEFFQHTIIVSALDFLWCVCLFQSPAYKFSLLSSYYREYGVPVSQLLSNLEERI